MKTLKRFFAMLTLLATLLSMLPLSARAVNAYWGFDDYETISNTGAPAEITSYPTTITKTSNSVYTITCQTDGGKLTLTLQEEDWGTFNMNKWYLTDKNGVTHNFVQGYTDLEYVHQTYYNNSSVTWSGGNHGGEALESLKFYNGETGKEITFSSIGSSSTVNVLHIIEKTNLLLFPDANNDSINDYINKNTAYTEDQIYAKLTRKYTITGPQVKLNVDYLYMRDTYHARCYSGMFPIKKDYGYYCDMFDKDGNFIKTIATRPYGDTSIADYAGPANSGNEATRAIIYSKDYPNYQFDIRVNTYKDSLNEFKNASYKTAYWDMDSTTNKLYFTRFDKDKKVLHAKGTEIHTECIWLFNYVTEGRQPSATEPAKGPEDNLARGRDYTISGTNDPVISETNGTNYSAKLTDGVAASAYNAANGSWFMFNSYTPNVINGKGSVTIDFDKICKITELRLSLINNPGWQVNAPSKIEVFGSTDGKAYTKIGDMPVDASATEGYWSELTVNNVLAGSVRFEFTLNGSFAVLNEAEVHGSETTSAYPMEAPIKNTIDHIAIGKPITVSGNFTGRTTGAGIVIGAPSILNDGSAYSLHDSVSGNWMLYQTYLNSTAGELKWGNEFEAIIDLQGKYTIDSVKVHLANSSNTLGTSFNGTFDAPESVEAFALVNGEWVYLGKFDVNTTDATYWTEVTAPDNTVATQIKVVTILSTATETLGWGGLMDEIAVYGKAYVAPPATIDRLLGDVNNDGFVNKEDYLLLKRYCFDTVVLDDSSLLAADVNRDGDVNKGDYVHLKRFCFDTMNIDPEYIQIPVVE